MESRSKEGRTSSVKLDYAVEFTFVHTECPEKVGFLTEGHVVEVGVVAGRLDAADQQHHRLGRYTGLVQLCAQTSTILRE